MTNVDDRRRFKRLLRRRDFLAMRVANATNRESELDYDKAEVSALSWAIDLAISVYPELREEITGVSSLDKDKENG